MTTDFDALRQHEAPVFANLYRIDTATLNGEEKAQHQALLAQTYSSLVHLENTAFEALTAQSKAQLPALLASVAAMHAELGALKNVNERLNAVAKGVDVLGKIAKVLV